MGRQDVVCAERQRAEAGAFLFHRQCDSQAPRCTRSHHSALARTARISGTVNLEIVVAKDGYVREIRLIAGHPLVVRAAIDAVKQWLYWPTLLNGEPVEAVTTIDLSYSSPKPVCPLLPAGAR